MMSVGTIKGQGTDWLDKIGSQGGRGIPTGDSTDGVIQLDGETNR